MAKGEWKKWIKGKGPRPVDQWAACGGLPPAAGRRFVFTAERSLFVNWS